MQKQQEAPAWTAYTKQELYAAAKHFHKNMFDWRLIAIVSVLLNVYLFLSRSQTC